VISRFSQFFGYDLAYLCHQRAISGAQRARSGRESLLAPFPISVSAPRDRFDNWQRHRFDGPSAMAEKTPPRGARGPS
jgi:hypothetical protein